MSALFLQSILCPILACLAMTNSIPRTRSKMVQILSLDSDPKESVPVCHLAMIRTFGKRAEIQEAKFKRRLHCASSSVFSRVVSRSLLGLSYGLDKARPGVWRDEREIHSATGQLGGKQSIVTSPLSLPAWQSS
ncbi:hypothetical protein FB451DRAFT_1182524 [Mycena latifolia]|nr:hypothetical protein FB451DRAFT_1182524 [Mycena latifolia]